MFWMPLLLGAGLGAIMNKKDPLKGALMGGALGGVGGAAFPGLLGAGGATAGIAPGATAAGGAMGSGLLAGGEQGAMLAAQNAGLEGATAATNAGLESVIGTQAPAELVNMNSNAGMFDRLNYQTNGLLGQGMDTFDRANKFIKPIAAGVDTAKSMMPEDMPAPPAPSIRSSPPNLDAILQQGNQQRQFEMSEAEKRRQRMQQYAMNMRGY